MPTINLSFPDPAYSATVLPSVVTLKADLTLIETAINALDDNNIAAGAGIQYSKLNLTGGIVDADINATAAIALSKIDDINPWATHAGGVWGGFSPPPSNFDYRWFQIGKIVWVKYRDIDPGTSDAAHCTMLLPVQADGTHGYASGTCMVMDNGTWFTGWWYIANGGTVVSFGKVPGTVNGFTASGDKDFAFELFYESV